MIDPIPADRARRARAVVLAGFAALLASSAGCAATGSVSTSERTTMTTAPPTGPAADLSGPVAGRITEPASAMSVRLAAGYAEQEFFAAGTATAYQTVNPEPDDGHWTVVPTGTAAYRTRIIVRRPEDPARFNGTVLVEWFNVSGGVEAAPDWTYMSSEIVRGGYAYVGVSVQALGVMGGAGLLSVPGVPAGGGLRSTNPDRYGTLNHPGDQYAYDIYTQVARAVRADAHRVLGGLQPRHVLAVGESQSAFYLTSYVDAIEPMSHAFDGFFIHSRSGGAAPIGPESVASSISGAVRIRTDLPVPVFMFETETDLGPLLHYDPARQPDTDRIRTWEVAGTAHADAYLVGSAASFLDCRGSINEGPGHFVVSAALRALNRWVTDGTPPPTAPPLQLASTSPPTVARDAHGNALGGVRTPAVDAPVAALSGDAPPGSSLLCALFGSTVPFDDTTLLALYHDRAAYLAAYSTALDAAIHHGYLLADDRAALLDQARAVAFPR